MHESAFVAATHVAGPPLGVSRHCGGRSLRLPAVDAVTRARHVSCETLMPVSSLIFAAIARHESPVARSFTMRPIAFCSASLRTSVPSSAMQ